MTSRSNARADIFPDDFDRYQFLKLLGEAGKPGLSKGMCFLNGVYTQRYNKRHT